MSATATRTVLAACRAVDVVLGGPESRIAALTGIELEIGPGETLALIGRSGSGKTTLLHVLGGLLAPTAGSVEWEGAPLASLDAAARAHVRARGIAYVFQGSNLLPSFTARENVAFAARAAGAVADAELGPSELLELVGLAAKAASLPSELSDGEAQRVAIARALAQRPQLLLCDEPTGHLDSDTGERVLDLIEALQEELGFTLVVATHDAGIAARLARLVVLADGRIVHDEETR